MKRLIKNITGKFFDFDISPIDTGGLSKFFIFLIWGLNAILFIGEDNCDVFKNKVLASDNYTVCTLTKKISKAELYTETTLHINKRESVIISSYDTEIPCHDVILEPVGRSPPAA
ncbi:MAG: hypothetical protein EHM58_06515 [Ignavibacteriae bacterium]|nr:MAG: hypothetical protein EHM58_06515 [Ignavibacteriota bacterium]